LKHKLRRGWTSRPELRAFLQLLCAESFMQVYRFPPPRAILPPAAPGVRNPAPDPHAWTRLEGELILAQFLAGTLPVEVFKGVLVLARLRP
jgi:hypothetical protein